MKNFKGIWYVEFPGAQIYMIDFVPNFILFI